MRIWCCWMKEYGCFLQLKHSRSLYLLLRQESLPSDPWTLCSACWSGTWTLWSTRWSTPSSLWSARWSAPSTLWSAPWQYHFALLKFRIVTYFQFVPTSITLENVSFHLPYPKGFSTNKPLEVPRWLLVGKVAVKLQMTLSIPRHVCTTYSFPSHVYRCPWNTHGIHWRYEISRSIWSSPRRQTCLLRYVHLLGRG